MPPKKNATKATKTTTASPAEAATPIAAPLKPGDMVHYHAAEDSAPQASTAQPAVALNGRDLLVFTLDGAGQVHRDVQYSAARKAGCWSHRDAA